MNAKKVAPSVLEVRKGLARWKGHWPAIAKEAGIYYNTLALIARGERENPTVDTVDAIMKVINKLDTDIRYRDRIIVGGRK